MQVLRARFTLPLFVLSLLSGLTVAGQSSTGRALRIEDYYRVQTVGNSRIVFVAIFCASTFMVE